MLQSGGPTETSTFCSDVWNGFTVVKNGDVYLCCHLQPAMIGNIYTQTLREVANNNLAQACRRRTLDGKLSCHRSCNMVNPSPPIVNRAPSGIVPYSGFSRIHISFGEQCNINCIMCDHPNRHMARPMFLDEEVLIRNVDISPFTDILLQGGEPLCIGQCLRYMTYLESIGKKYTILTNGTLITGKMAERLARNAKLVSISINAASEGVHERINLGSDFKKVLRGVELMASSRDRLGTTMQINGRMTLTPQNIHEIPSFISSFRKFGFDTVNFGFDRETVPQYLERNPSLVKDLRVEIERTLIGRGS